MRDWAAGLLLALLAAAYFLPSLGYGLVWEDDFRLLRESIFAPDSLAHRFILSRPLQILSFPLVAAVSDTVLAQRIASLILFALCVLLGFALVRRHRIAPLAILLVFSHPSFLYPVTWIAQRNDLFLIGCAAAMMLWLESGRGFVFMLLSDLSKTPFVFQNLLFAWHAWRRGRRWWCVGALAAAGVMLFTVYLSYYVANQEVANPVGLWAIHPRDIAGLALVGAVRCAKILEGALLAFVPFPAFYGTGLLPVAVMLYAASWAVIFRLLLRAENGAREPMQLILLGLLMLPPLAFSPGLRILAPIVVFLFLGILTRIRFSATLAAAAAVIALLNLGGSLLNYSVSDTGCYDRNLPTAAEDCDFRAVPIINFEQDRGSWRDDLIRRFAK